MSDSRKDPKIGSMSKEGYIIGRGENKKVIPPDEVEKLAKLWCSYQEIADWFQIPVETLKYNFRDLIAKGRAETKQALRRAQLKVAIGGNTSMLIWLGKNILGQSDNLLSSAEKAPLPWIEQVQDDKPNGPTEPNGSNEPNVVIASGQLKPVSPNFGKPKPLGTLTLKDE